MEAEPRNTRLGLKAAGVAHALGERGRVRELLLAAAAALRTTEVCPPTLSLPSHSLLPLLSEW